MTFLVSKCLKVGCFFPSHHPLDYDDLRPQRSTDGEDGHEAEAEDHEVDAEDDFTRVEQLGG